MVWAAPLPAGEVAAAVDVPLATNMCVIAMDHLPPAIASDAVQVVLSDHHLWGGLRRSALLAGICDTWGLGLSMHSNSHLGVSLAAMVHLASATPNLTYACDTHYPWKAQDVIEPGVLSFEDGSLAALDTHDTATFAGFWNGRDLEQRTAWPPGNVAFPVESPRTGRAMSREPLAFSSIQVTRNASSAGA